MFLYQCTFAVGVFFSVSAPLPWMCFSACQPCWLKGIVGVHIDIEHIMASCCLTDRGDNRDWGDTKDSQGRTTEVVITRGSKKVFLQKNRTTTKSIPSSLRGAATHQDLIVKVHSVNLSLKVH